MAKKPTTPAAAPTAPATPAPAAPKPPPTKKATPAPAQPQAPKYPVYPAVKDFTAADLKAMKAEYAELKAIESPDEEQATRKAALAKLGKEINQRITVEGPLPGSTVTTKSSTKPATPKSVDIKTVIESINRVIPFEKPIDVEQDETALKQILVEVAKEFAVKDFTAHKNEDGTDGEFFSAQDIADLIALGITLPAGVVAEKKGKTPKAPKAAKTPRTKYAGTEKITILVKENPKRNGSESAKRFAFYKNGMTVESALKAGVNPGDICWDINHKFISIA